MRQNRVTGVPSACIKSWHRVFSVVIDSLLFLSLVVYTSSAKKYAQEAILFFEIVGKKGQSRPVCCRGGDNDTGRLRET